MDGTPEWGRPSRLCCFRAMIGLALTGGLFLGRAHHHGKNMHGICVTRKSVFLLEQIEGDLGANLLTDRKPTANRPQTDRKPPPNRPQVDLKPTPNRPQTDPKPTPNRPQTDPKPIPNRPLKHMFRAAGPQIWAPGPQFELRDSKFACRDAKLWLPEPQFGIPAL